MLGIRLRVSHNRGIQGESAWRDWPVAGRRGKRISRGGKRLRSNVESDIKVIDDDHRLSRDGKRGLVAGLRPPPDSVAFRSGTDQCCSIVALHSHTTTMSHRSQQERGCVVLVREHADVLVVISSYVYSFSTMHFL
jgi:hypothetical protein